VMSPSPSTASGLRIFAVVAALGICTISAMGASYQVSPGSTTPDS
jgi:hypothetical protein